MRRKWFIAAIFLLFCPLLWGQSFNDLRVLKLADLTDQEIEKIMDLSSQFELVKRKTTIEQNYYKAQLERLLLSPDPDMKEVEEVLQTWMDWKTKETLADIHRRVETRKTVGEEKWVRLLRLLSELRQQNAEPQRQN